MKHKKSLKKEKEKKKRLKIKPKRLKKEKKPKSSSLPLLLALFLIGTLVIIFFCILVIPTKTISCQSTETVMEDVPYTEKEGRYVDKPYTYNDCYDKQLIFDTEWQGGTRECINNLCINHEQYCVKKNFWGNCVEFRERCIRYQCQLYKRYCKLKVENKDDVGGFFTIIGQQGTSSNRGKNIQEIKNWIKARDDVMFTWSFTYTDFDESHCWSQTKQIPTKKVCTQRIGYKPEYVEEDVIKWKKEPKTVITPYNKKVNWLIGRC